MAELYTYRPGDSAELLAYGPANAKTAYDGDEVSMEARYAYFSVEAADGVGAAPCLVADAGTGGQQAAAAAVLVLIAAGETFADEAALADGELAAVREQSDLTETTGGLRKHDVMTTAVRDGLTPEAGWIIYNSTTAQFEGYSGAVWVALTPDVLTAAEISAVRLFSDLNAATGGHRVLDVVTTAQRDALTPSTGWIVYNSTTAQLELYSAMAWAAVGGGGGDSPLAWEGNPAINGTLTVDFLDAGVSLATHAVQITMYSTVGNPVFGIEDWAVAAGVFTSLKREESSGLSQVYRDTDWVSVALIPLTALVVSS